MIMTNGSGEGMWFYTFLLETPGSHKGLPVCILAPLLVLHLPVNAYPGRQWMLVQVPTSDPSIEFQAPGFDLGVAPAVEGIWG